MRAVGSLIGAVWLAATLSFLALRAVPGDAVTDVLRAGGASAEVIETRRAALGLDAPVLVQYLHMLLGAVRGDLGVSLIDGRAVVNIIESQLGPTLALAVGALLTACLLGIGLGALIGFEMPAAPLASLALNLALSMPIYASGTLAILIFTVALDLLPAGGGARASQLILPIGVLGFHTAGSIGRVFATALADVRGAAYIRTARAKGLPEGMIALRHVLRAAAPPLVTVIGLQAAFLMGGVVIVESLFARPGLGRVLLNAVLQQDYPLVQGIVIYLTVVYALINCVVEVANLQIDPRRAA